MDCDIEKYFDPYEGRPLKIVTRALCSNRLAHAYLITGPDSFVTSANARAAAKLLLCLSPEHNERVGRPCSKCPACRKVDSDTHPDLLQIEPQGAFIKIGQIKEMQRQFSFPPLEGRRRIAVIHHAETLGLYASNALLKILEEPPEYGHLILSAVNPKTLLPTITSRCQHLHQGPIPDKTISDFLASKGISHPYLIHLSEGSVSRAKMLLDADIVGFRDKFIDFLKTQKGWEALLMQLAQQASMDQETFKRLLHVVSSVVHDMLILKSSKPRTANKDTDCLVCKDKKLELADVASDFEACLLEEYSEILLKMEFHLARNANRLLMALALLLFWKIKKFGTLRGYGK